MHNTVSASKTMRPFGEHEGKEPFEAKRRMVEQSQDTTTDLGDNGLFSLTKTSQSSFLVSGSSTSHLLTTQNAPQHPSRVVSPGKFDPEKHFYERVLEAKLHPVVEEFFGMSMPKIIDKYCETHEGVDRVVLEQILTYVPLHFFWSGVDLLYVRPDRTLRAAAAASAIRSQSPFPADRNEANEQKPEMMILETNSCPSGQKSMPSVHGEIGWGGGYATLMTRFYELATDRAQAGLLPTGSLAIVYDKNLVEVSGYAKQLANVSGENIYMVELYNDDPSPCAKWDDRGILSVRTADGCWHQIRAAFRYVTQQPWTRIPVNSKTFVFNSILSCLAGGRNKLVGHKAYEELNNSSLLSGSNLAVRTPRTICDVLHKDIPAMVRQMHYRAVIKIPYSNAGQGVFTVHSKVELDEFMVETSPSPHGGGSGGLVYEKFIIQELIDSVGTVPLGPRNWSFVWDLRVMIVATPQGYRPLVMYARKAAAPLLSNLASAASASAAAAAAAVSDGTIAAVGTVGASPSTSTSSSTSTSASISASASPSASSSSTADSNNNNNNNNCNDSLSLSLSLSLNEATIALTDAETDSTTSSSSGGADSRSMYLTNLSEKLGENQWTTDTGRLVVLDDEDFGSLGLDMDGMVDGYVQAVLATVAIDKMAVRLWTAPEGNGGVKGRGRFDREAFGVLSDDAGLLGEIMIDGDSVVDRM